MQGSRVMMSNGVLPSARLDKMAASHPFIQQIDVVFPSSPRLKQAFSSLETTYTKGQYSLSEVYEYACQNVSESLEALPVECNDDDTWCIDPRGIMTLCVSKVLYEKLGLVGHKLPFKGCPDQYIIRITLRKQTESVGMRARQREALKIWDSIRETDGLGKWEVVFVGAASANPSGPHQAVGVKPRIREDEDVFLPVPTLVQSAEESSEDWNERMGELFEWAGMACLGAQRLKANDRVDPYVAVYETPSPSRIGNLTHIRWKGLMETTFVQSLIDTATSIASTSPNDDGSFISILLFSDPVVPVPYIPPSSDVPGVSEVQAKQPPLRAPRPDAEDTSCLILASSSGQSPWVMGQSIGKWDARWG